MPDDAPWIEPVVVPDDLRELQADIDAYHRELRGAARRRLLSRVTSTRAWRRTAVPLAVACAALALAGVVFAILTIGQPRARHGPLAAPLATAPAAGVGERLGLVPDAPLTTAGGTMSMQELRPALVALVPLRCGCSRLLSSLAGQATEVTVPLVVVAPTARDAEVAALAGQIHQGNVVPAFDAGGVMADTYDANGVTVIVVARDGTVTYIARDVDAAVRLEPYLQQMVSLRA